MTNRQDSSIVSELSGMSEIELLNYWLGGNCLGIQPSDYYGWRHYLWSNVLSKCHKSDRKDLFYEGKVYRAMIYNSECDGIIYPIENYQSWSKDFDCLADISKFRKGDDIVVIEGYVDIDDYAIDLNNYLEYIMGDGYTNSYLDEFEIVAPVTKDIITNVYSVNMHTFEGVNTISKVEDIPYELWFRNDFPEIRGDNVQS